MHKGIMGAIVAAALLGGAPGMGDRAAIMPRRQEVPRAPGSRDERKKRLRRFGSLSKKLRRSLNRDYVAHDRDGDSALCGRQNVYDGWERRNGVLLYGTHRFAEFGEPIMCNDCQRAKWRRNQQKRSPA